NRLLQDEVVKPGEVKFSADGLKRLAERHITLSPSDLRKINEAASAAEAKGARQSLLIYGDLALVASLDNRTVVTAVSGAQSEQRIFTNIDSAVIIR
ncbi:MAG: flagellar protein, partial [Candidatus Desulforudis sp.]|nr:flagellar protein [Desulforudis sp.]